MVQIVTRDDKVYITDTAKGDIEVNIGMHLVLYNFVGEVIALTPTTTPTITVQVVETNQHFKKNERILLTNVNDYINAKSLDNSDKPPKVINFVKIYRRVEGTVSSPDEDQFPLTPTSTKWHRDEDYNKCEICGKEFGMFTRKHHCRECGKVVCDDCSPYEKKGNRVCKKCNFPFATAIPKDGGYKRRQSKRKRKNKRSLTHRHTTKRTNIRRRSKKNNKRTRRYRKSSHHR
jgi:hypothetical protein